MRRNKRRFHAEFANLNADMLIVVRWKRISYWCDERARFKVFIANGAAHAVESVSLEISPTNRRQLPQLAPGSVCELDELEAPLPAVRDACTHLIYFELRQNGRCVLARNHIDVAIHPRPNSPIRVATWSPDSSVRSRLAALGYRLAVGLGRLILSSQPRLSPSLPIMSATAAIWCCSLRPPAGWTRSFLIGRRSRW